MGSRVRLESARDAETCQHATSTVSDSYSARHRTTTRLLARFCFLPTFKPTIKTTFEALMVMSMLRFLGGVAACIRKDGMKDARGGEFPSQVEPHRTPTPQISFGSLQCTNAQCYARTKSNFFETGHGWPFRSALVHQSPPGVKFIAEFDPFLFLHAHQPLTRSACGALISPEPLQVTRFGCKQPLFFAVFAQTLRCAPHPTHGFMRQNVK